MGKGNLRRIASALCKKHGSKLYRNFKVSRKKLSSRLLKEIISQLSVNVNDIIFDCDGFNHRVKKINHSYCRGPHHASGYWWAPRSEFEFEDGAISCTCYHSISPLSREEIEANELNFLNAIDKTEIVIEAIERISNGDHITDEYGILLNKYKHLYR